MIVIGVTSYSVRERLLRMDNSNLEDEELDKALKQVLDRIRGCGLKLNKEKCSFRVTKTFFLGHLISADGIKPDPCKVEAILEMPSPSNKEKLQRFLGMITYLGKFLPTFQKKQPRSASFSKKMFNGVLNSNMKSQLAS